MIRPSTSEDLKTIKSLSESRAIMRLISRKMPELPKSKEVHISLCLFVLFQNISSVIVSWNSFYNGKTNKLTKLILILLNKAGRSWRNQRIGYKIAEGVAKEVFRVLDSKYSRTSRSNKRKTKSRSIESACDWRITTQGN